MTFDWKRHSMCLCVSAYDIDERIDCNADRALMVAEGERLERELAGYERECSRVHGVACRLREALEEITETDGGHWTDCILIARAALEVKP